MREKENEYSHGPVVRTALSLLGAWVESLALSNLQMVTKILQAAWYDQIKIKIKKNEKTNFK